MPDAVCYLGWESYINGPDGRGFFAQELLSFNSRQGRLHQVSPGDHVWLVSRDPDNRQYYIVGVLRWRSGGRTSRAGSWGRLMASTA